ncbi:MAG: ABC transporter ATP-binding protein [Bacillota bacterium]
MSDKYVLEIKDLKKNFSGFEALKNISLRVKKGDILGLLGPNGAGKTTTIKIVTGLLKADHGEIRLFGKKTSGSVEADIKARIGVVFEESNLYSRLSAFDNLMIFANINNVKVDRVKKLLKEYELYEVRNKEVKNFSKGMKKRLMICRALLAQPELLIFDEATGGLDPISAEIIREKLLSLKSQGKTVLLSTHYLEEADRLCDNVAFVNKGRIIAFNSPAFFKDKLSQKFLKLQFSLQKDKISLDKLKKDLNKFVKNTESFTIDKTTFSIFLVIDEEVFARADKLCRDYQFIEVNREEANLQRVFKVINS